MNISQLPKITDRKKRRVGQGHGSGRVKTSGRGTKGQKARRTIPYTRYSGGSLAFVKRLPLLRGKMRNYSLQEKPLSVNIEKLNGLPKGTVVDTKVLIEKKIITAKNVKYRTVKILGDGDLSIALRVKLPVSKIAKEKIEKAGGTVEV
ncbi:MAG TPA: 50S ribosomal protein L15 [Patescibacteria group bacterium]|nr:50S ribosomal protein L15 [Patescibacteria group bacterium]